MNLKDYQQNFFCERTQNIIKKNKNNKHLIFNVMLNYLVIVTDYFT